MSSDAHLLQSGPKLSDLTAAVPDLMSGYILKEWRPTAYGIKQLRLVSKDWGAVALTAVSRCNLNLGGCCDIAAEKLAKLVSEGQLQSLKVNLHTSEGGPQTLIFECMIGRPRCFLFQVHGMLMNAPVGDSLLLPTINGRKHPTSVVEERPNHADLELETRLSKNVS